MRDNTTEYTVDSHFAGKSPVVREIYDFLLATVQQFGPIIEEAKKTSIHLVHTTAFAGVATRKQHLVLTIKSDSELNSPRFHKVEQVSAKRFHGEIKIASPTDIDDEVRAWLSNAYALSA